LIFCYLFYLENPTKLDDLMTSSPPQIVVTPATPPTNAKNVKPEIAQKVFLLITGNPLMTSHIKWLNTNLI